MRSDSGDSHVSSHAYDSIDKKRFCPLLIVLVFCSFTVLTCTAILDADDSCADPIVTEFTVGGLEYQVTYGKCVAVSGCDRTMSGNLIIPSSVTYADTVFYVTSIGFFAFKDCTSLTAVAIPNSVIFVSSAAFDGCTSMIEIHVLDGNCIYSSVNGVLFNIGMTELVKCPAGRYATYTVPDSVRSIDESAFSDCRSLISVNIPHSVVSIGRYAFSNCTSLTSVVSFGNVLSIGECAFADCISLKSVTIPYGLTVIEAGTFRGCRSLESVTLPDSVVRIDYFAFVKCRSLISVTIPCNVASIRNSAFLNCSGLENVILLESKTTIMIGENTFKGCSDLLRIYVSSTKYKDYMDSGCWSSMKDRFVLSNPVIPAEHRICDLLIITVPPAAVQYYLHSKVFGQWTFAVR